MSPAETDAGSEVQARSGAATPLRVDPYKSLFRQIGWTLGWGFSASLILAGGAVARAMPALVGEVSHGTGDGRQAYALADGSVVTLDAYSQFEARISPFGREIHLSKGQAMIQIDRNWGQPFRVLAGSKGVAGKAEIVGGPYQAAFAVKVVQDDSIEVLPIERSSIDIVYPAHQLQAPKTTWDTLTAGVRTVARVDSAQQRVENITQAEQVARLGWLSGQVVFSNTPLKAAVAEMNRYSIGSELVLSDVSLADVPISGTFEEDVLEFAVDLERACTVKIATGAGAYSPFELKRADPDCKPRSNAATLN